MADIKIQLRFNLETGKKDIIIKYDPARRVIKACLKHSPYCIPPPYLETNDYQVIY